MHIREEEIETIRSHADIVDVIGRYLQVHKKGKSYVALCPFHDDHDPSMTISPDRQIYKCFVCGAGGNVFSFVQNYEKISFPEAVARVASLTGQTLSVSPDSFRPKAVDPHAEKLHHVLQETVRYTMYQLNTEAGASQKQYLEKRGLDSGIQERFEIGYNPDGDALYGFLKAKGYEDSDMVDCNVARVAGGSIHDVFSSRITFPIHDEQGNPIGFTARSTDPENPSKYINTNETPLFTKGNIVYNAHRAKLSARRLGKVYVCEGVTDVIAFYRAGIENCVCTLGTACTSRQLKLLKSMAARIVFCYDGDDPGQAATWKAAKAAREMGCEVSIIDNRTGMDPDEIICQKGREALQNLASSEITWMEFVLAYLQKRTNFSSYMERKEFVQKVQAEIDLLDDDLDRRHFTDELSRISGFHLDYQPKQKASVQNIKLHAVKMPNGQQEAENLILTLMMNSRKAADQFQQELGFLNIPAKQTLAMMIVDGYRRNADVSASALIDRTQDPKIRDLITSLATGWKKDIPYDEQIMEGAIRKVKIATLSSKAAAFKQQLQTELSYENKEVVLNEYQACLVELRRYIDEENSEKDKN